MEDGGVFCNHKVATGVDRGIGGESEIDSATESPTRKIDRRRRGIVEFNEFLGNMVIWWIGVDFVNNDCLCDLISTKSEIFFKRETHLVASAEANAKYLIGFS